MIKTGKVFEVCKETGGYGITMRSGVKGRFDKIDNRGELILRICEELESHIEEHLNERGIKNPHYLGFDQITLSVAESKDAYEEDVIDTEILKPDIWECQSNHSYDGVNVPEVRTPI